MDSTGPSRSHTHEAVMGDQRPPPPLEQSMRELTLEDGRRDPGPPSRPPESITMDLDDDGVLRQYPRHILPAVPSGAAAPPGGAAAVGAVVVGHDRHMDEARRGVPPPDAQQARALARDLEAILLEMLPEGSVLIGYTANGYLFS